MAAKLKQPTLDITIKVDRRVMLALVKQLEEIRVRMQADISNAIAFAAMRMFVVKARRIRGKRKPKGRK